MERKIVKQIIKVEGMTCASCELRIENSLKKLNSIIDVKAKYSESKVYVTYDANVISVNKIAEIIEKLDYKVARKTAKADSKATGLKKVENDKLSINQIIGVGVILLAGYVIIKNTIGFNFIPEVTQNMGYGLLFVIGLITSLHCVAMCGGINLAQCVSYKTSENDTGKFSKLKPSLMYNVGRIISYTIIGGIVGALGSVVSFSGTAKGVVAIFAGLFMVIMGLNMLNIFPWLRKFNPRMPKIFGKKVHNNNGKHGPFYVGLLNGLMPCGPLQSMQLYALGTGSFLAGATSMFFFSVGTVPLMFGFGALSSLLSGKFTKKMMKASAILVIVLGLIMANRGLSLSGVNLVTASTSSGNGNVSKIENGVQVITTTLENGRYTPFTVQKGIPVKWTIKASQDDLNGCNNPVTIPKFNIQKKLVAGDNVIEFTPDKEGNITYTCWMGMIRSNIKVVADINTSSEQVQEGNNITEDPFGEESGLGNEAGELCVDGAKATKFANGNIPTDEVQVAKLVDGKQIVTVKVNDYGYSPAVFVIEKGVEVKIKFDAEKLNSCNNIVAFPAFQGQIDLREQKETPFITAQNDFIFQCGKGMLNGYVKVVDDIDNIDIEAIKNEIQNYEPASGGSGSGYGSGSGSGSGGASCH